MYKTLGFYFLLSISTILSTNIAADKTPEKQDHILNIGEEIFSSRCILCHGKEGDGKGRMAKILQTPPANLIVSQLSDDDLKAIITNGGESVGRSSNMPAWGPQFSTDEINSIIIFIKSIRN